MTKKKYKILVDDNFHFMDESERYASGEFATYEEAAVKCKAIVDDFLVSAIEPGMTAEQLFGSYTMFGEDPYIIGGKENSFEAWDYAKKQCVVLIKKQQPKIKKAIG